MHKKDLFDDLGLFPVEHFTYFEENAWKNGYKVVAGVDEAGRGPLAGPVVAASCIIPPELIIDGINDSKKLTPKARSRLYQELTSNTAIYYSIGVVDEKIIDKVNIYQATIQAMAKAVACLQVTPDFLLIDGLPVPMKLPSQAIVKGDSRSQLIAAASIIAKETRDRMMCEYHEQWPEYGFDRHKGYGTKAHIAALQEHGPCPIHRRSFEPIKSMIEKN